MRDSMIFYRSFYEAIKELNLEQQALIYNAMFSYGLNYEEPELTGVCKTVWTLIKPQIDANIRRFSNGNKGGRPPKEKTETKPKNNLNETETKANNNNNVNNNNNNNENNTKVYASEVLPENEKPLILPEHFDKMLAYFNKTFNKDIKQITRYQRENFYNLIRKGYTQFTIKDVIDNLKNDEFCKSRNYIHVTIDYISQIETVEKYAFVHLANKKEPKPTKGYGVSWL